jgi:DNA modification methylase
MSQLALFYSQLDTGTRSFVEMRAGEIKALARRSALDIFEIGCKLLEVKARLDHGQFGVWLKDEFDWSRPTAARFMQVAGRFGEKNYQIDNFAPSALCLLAAPSTPEEAVEEAVAQASNGHVTHKEAKEIVNRHKTWKCPFCDYVWQASQRDCPECRNRKPTKVQVEHIVRLRQESPDLFEQVKEGQLSLSYAMRKLGAEKSEKRTESRQQSILPAENTRPMPRLIVGDATNLHQLADESIDVIITSPPYNLGDESWPMGGYGRVPRANGIGYRDDLAQEPYEEWQLCVIEELYRVAKPGASLFYNHKTRTQDGILQHPMTWLCRAYGWTLRQEIIWDREVTHNHSKSLFWPVDERIYWFTKGKPAISEDGIGMPSVWRFHGPEPYTWHPAPFPEGLPQRCLQAVGRPGITVLDPFAGSCTTLRVALAHGYEAIGVDIQADYLDQARDFYGWL